MSRYPRRVLERWIRLVLRWRYVVLAAWLVVLVAGVAAAGSLQGLLSVSFSVPGSDSERARAILAEAFGERPDGTFTVVVQAADTRDRAERRQLRSRLGAAASAVPTAKAGRVRDGDGILYGDIATRLDLQEAKGYTDAIRRALRAGGGPVALVTGQPAIQHDLDPVFTSDMRRGELVAVPVALVVLLVVFGLSLAVAVPFVFAACTIAGTLAAVYLLAHAFTMATYVPSLVELIGLGLAIDYSLLAVYRFREELARTDLVDEAIVRTMATAGRTVVFSGTAVAIGLALLLLMPVPFIRSVGAGGLLIPVVSVAGMLTLQPALLSMLGRRGIRRVPVAAVTRARIGLPPVPVSAGTDVDRGFWARHSRAIMRRPLPFLVVGSGLLVAAALPAFSLELTPGSLSGIPSTPEASRGYALLREGIGPGVVTPTMVVIDAGRPGAAEGREVQAAIDRLGDRLFRDFELVAIGSGAEPPYVDASGQYARLVAAGSREYGAPSTRRFVERLREQEVPAARFPSDVRVWAGGAPPQGVDFLERAYAAFPWLVAAVLLVTYVVLLRAFRSVLLPLKAVLLNLLTVAAVVGLLVVVFEWGATGGLLGLQGDTQVEAWIPIFLFAVLFGLSMDYEVFMVARMRESWDHVPENLRAVAHGLEHTGRIVTAAAVIMVAAFAGFVAGNIAALQQLGVGLALGVLIDATLVRAILVPSLMAVLGRYNWWLPERLARLAFVDPSPLSPPERTPGA